MDKKRQVFFWLPLLDLNLVRGFGRKLPSPRFLLDGLTPSFRKRNRKISPLFALRASKV